MNKPLYYSKLVLKKDKSSSVENTLMLKFDKAIFKNDRINNIDIIINVMNSVMRSSHSKVLLGKGVENVLKRFWKYAANLQENTHAEVQLQ